MSLALTGETAHRVELARLNLRRAFGAVVPLDRKHTPDANAEPDRRASVIARLHMLASSPDSAAEVCAACLGR